MSNLRLAFVIDAVDRASAVINRINARVDRMTAPALRARAAFNGVIESLRSERMQGAITKLGERGAALASWGRGMATGALAIGAAATAAGYSMKSTMDTVDNMLDQATKLNVPVEMYQKLGYAAQLNGSNQQEMGQALQFLSQNMVEAMNGGKEMQLWFARVGITMGALKKMNAVQVFEAISDVFEKAGDSGQNAEKKIALLRAMMGRGGAELKQLLDIGSGGLRQFYAEAEALKGIVSEADAKKIALFNDQWDKMKTAMFGTAGAVASAAAPALQEVVRRLTAWTVASHDLNKEAVEKHAKEFADRLEDIAKSLGQIASALSTVIGLADRFAQAVGGWQNVILAVVAVIVGKGVWALGLFAHALWGVAAAFVATPFGLAAVAVAAVAAAALLAYTHFDKLVAKLHELKAAMPNWMSNPDNWAILKLLPSVDLGSVGTAGDVAPSGAVASAIPGAPAASAVVPRPFGRQDLGGTLRIELDGNAVPRVTMVKKNSNLLDFDVYSGAQMVTP